MVYETYDGEIISEVYSNDTQITEEIIISTEEGTEVLDQVPSTQDSDEILEYLYAQALSDYSESSTPDYSSILSCILIFVVAIFCFLFLTRFKR